MPKIKKTVIITGASRGIGAAAAAIFAGEGWNVAVNYNSSRERAENIAGEIGGIAVKADVSVRREVDSMVETVMEKYGRIDALINNAGIAANSLFTDITEEEWDRIFSVDVKGVFNCTQAVLPHMIRKKSGRIINISSMWGVTGASCEVHYSAAKAAVIGMTKALAKEVGPSGITVNCIAPGVIDTEMNKNLTPEDIETLRSETPLGIIGSPYDIAAAALFLASSRADFITGQVLGINGGFII